MQLTDMTCCAVLELSDLGLSQDNIAEGLRDLQPDFFIPVDDDDDNYNEAVFMPPCRYIVFTAARSRDDHGAYGDALKAFILTNSLGTVTETGWNVNPNTKNAVNVYTWTLDFPALEKWFGSNSNPTGQES